MIGARHLVQYLPAEHLRPGSGHSDEREVLAVGRGLDHVGLRIRYIDLPKTEKAAPRYVGPCTGVAVDQAVCAADPVRRIHARHDRERAGDIHDGHMPGAAVSWIEA